MPATPRPRSARRSTSRPKLTLPKQWSETVKAGVLNAIALARVSLTAARSTVIPRHRLRARLEQAESEIALLREDLAIKDGRWARSHSRKRPHYTGIQRMRILQLRAARGWTLEKTGKTFLVDLQTLMHWTQRVDEPGERPLVQTVEPINRYPDFVRAIVRQLKGLFPTMGTQRIADTLARAGLHLSPTTVRRFLGEQGDPVDDEPVTRSRRRRVVARYPGHTWHVDLTAVPTQAGLWVPWFPSSLPQYWPFCWWVAIAVDQVSRACVGVEVFYASPSAGEMQQFLERIMRDRGQAPRYIITDRGVQFTARSYRRGASGGTSVVATESSASLPASPSQRDSSCR